MMLREVAPGRWEGGLPKEDLERLVGWLYSLREYTARHDGQLIQDRPRIVIPEARVVAGGFNHTPRFGGWSSGQVMYDGRIEIGVLYTRSEQGLYTILGLEKEESKHGLFGARFWYNAQIGHWGVIGDSIWGFYREPHWWTRDHGVQITPVEMPRFAR